MAGARDSPPASYSTDPHETDPPLLRDHSHFETFRTSRFEYPNVRVFFRQHAKAKELPAPLPLIVCIPGLGGSVAQFHPLLSSLVDLGPCLAIDYPGGGRSDYAVTSWDAYSSQALMELLEVIIEHFRDKAAGQSLVLIGHSMGTALAAGLSNRKAEHANSLAEHVVGLVAICPLAGPWDESTTATLRRLLWVPGWLFSMWRAWDGMGGPDSPSVLRFVGKDAEPELRLLQFRFNQQSRTPVWRRMAYGALPLYVDGKPVGGIPGPDAWAGLDFPVFLIAGEKDHLTPPGEIDKIEAALASASSSVESINAPRPEVANSEATDPVKTVSSSPEHHTSHTSSPREHCRPSRSNPDQQSDAPECDLDPDPSTPVGTEDFMTKGPTAILPPQPRHPPKSVQSIVMPRPANHALLYMPRSARALAGHVAEFLATHVTQRLSLAWQLQYLSREGKWDVKNLDKWKSVAPVSDAIGPQGKAIFRAMKTLREVDEVHCPVAFVRNWGSVIRDVIDISKDQPVYDPRGLERGGVHYHKFPTVSKIPPEADEVDAFISLVDRLRDAQEERATAEAWEEAGTCVIGVHCHYGFNRTGYFIVCYLVERCGFALPDAIELFATARPNGIRHSHFLDRLYVRYTSN